MNISPTIYEYLTYNLWISHLQFMKYVYTNVRVCEKEKKWEREKERALSRRQSLSFRKSERERKKELSQAEETERETLPPLPPLPRESSVFLSLSLFLKERLWKGDSASSAIHDIENHVPPTIYENHVPPTIYDYRNVCVWEKGKLCILCNSWDIYTYMWVWVRKGKWKRERVCDVYLGMSHVRESCPTYNLWL